MRRILDLGCSCGQTTVALKRRFPDAEVWGIDVGGPMLHYAHMRATELGVDVNFRQALAEATGFPDGYFDMVVSYILLHEVPNVKNTEIMKEISRLLRSGGTYYPVDFLHRRLAAEGCLWALSPLVGSSLEQRSLGAGAYGLRPGG